MFDPSPSPAPPAPGPDRTVTVRPWADPLLDRFGHRPGSPYVERFWLPVLGPSATILLRRLTERFDEEPAGYTLDLADASRAMGMGGRNGPGASFRRTLDRMASFGFIRLTPSPAGPCPAILAVRRRLPQLTQRQLQRLPPGLRDDHASWMGAAAAGDVPDDAGVHHLAVSLLEVGESPAAVEAHLRGLGVHPDVVHRVLRTAFADRTTSRDDAA